MEALDIGDDYGKRVGNDERHDGFEQRRGRHDGGEELKRD